MAQESCKVDADETGCQPPSEFPMLCSNNCGFFGSSTTLNLCSQCYRDVLLKQAKVAEVAAAMSAVHAHPLLENEPHQQAEISVETASSKGAISEAGATSSEGAKSLAEQPSQKPNRCLTCNKRVGLTGFKCRCGGLFCSLHRYNDKHDCTFDYKAAAQNSIRKANPVVRADKLDKI
ncbi:hypothetical protein GOP47_0004626 [Adiantum capillus-veneris]|uniref:Uncharacterized protein n=1 Tax=Adiantum capillus-veneris TaxID=13818 RepID=A0A9D4ZMT2_ADICA|nr:hypothetical protein GOP47_0004626 [Adiantum capillus-veneris]